MRMKESGVQERSVRTATGRLLVSLGLLGLVSYGLVSCKVPREPRRPEVASPPHGEVVGQAVPGWNCPGPYSNPQKSVTYLLDESCMFFEGTQNGKRYQAGNCVQPGAKVLFDLGNCDGGAIIAIASPDKLFTNNDGGIVPGAARHSDGGVITNSDGGTYTVGHLTLNASNKKMGPYTVGSNGGIYNLCIGEEDSCVTDDTATGSLDVATSGGPFPVPEGK